MFPFYKTVISLFGAKLYYIMILCGVIAASLVTAFAGFFIWVFCTRVDIPMPFFDWLASFSIGLVFVAAACWSLPSMIILASGLFSEIVIGKINKVYYPDQVQKPNTAFLSDLKQDIKLTVLSLFLNTLLLPFYFFFGVGFFLYLFLNTYLLSREFFVNAAGYHLGKTEGLKLLSRHKTVIWIGGFVITLLTITPIINLFMPIFATTWMVHLFHKINSDTSR